MPKVQYSIHCIVAATDFSANGDLAVMRAAHIAQQHGQALHLLHVVHPLDIYPELMLTFDAHLKDYERLKKANGLASLDELAIKIRKDFDIKVKTATRIGRTHVQIAEYVESVGADLLVVGFHGEQNVLDAIIGSTAFRLLRLAPCSLLIVRNGDIVPYQQVLTAVDFTIGASAVPRMACAVATTAPIEALHVFDLKQETLSRKAGISHTEVQHYRDKATEYAEDTLAKLVAELNEKRISSKVMYGYLPETICDRATEINADLVVLGKKGKSSLQEFVLGSVSKTVASMVSCDVLLT
ncbi:MAG: universal stress protein [Methylophilaceae bacterium]|jgi:nucleotide-binding universal stress UspA family protein|nr:MAG: universal stress protein [Methylophilaceae bacterium]